MLPPKTDPRWQSLVTGEISYTLRNFAVKMMLTRLKTAITFDSSPQKVNECISVAHDFFAKNMDMTKDDINIIFGRGVDS